MSRERQAIRILVGDTTSATADAIVNAAKPAVPQRRRCSPAFGYDPDVWWFSQEQALACSPFRCSQ